MTKQTSHTPHFNPNRSNANKSKMNILAKILGLHYCDIRVVFEHEGKEIVFIFEGTGFVSVYVNGTQVLRRWNVRARETVLHHANTEYRFITEMIDAWRLKYRISLLVDGSKKQAKVATMFSDVSTLEKVHFSIVPFLIGIIPGTLFGNFILRLLF